MDVWDELKIPKDTDHSELREAVIDLEKKMNDAPVELRREYTDRIKILSGMSLHKNIKETGHLAAYLIRTATAYAYVDPTVLNKGK